MTWVIGATAFNGLVGVADVQVTFEYLDKSGPPRYYNCVRKLHKAHDNLYIGFSGDVKSGLLIIERVIADMAIVFREGELFDIEGQLSGLQSFLQCLYKSINGEKSPKLELMFLWVKQEGESPVYEPACMRFIAPEFGTDGIGMLQISQSGSGVRSEDFQALVEFLKGRSPEEGLRQKFFPNTPYAPVLWTASKIRTLLISEGNNINFPGVSKTFLSVVAELGWDRIVSATTNAEITSKIEDLGVVRRQEKTRSDTLNIFEIDFEKIDESIKELQKSDPAKLAEIMNALYLYKLEESFDSLCELPKFKEMLHHGEGEAVELSSLCSTWAEMEAFMVSKRIFVGECTAMA